VNEHVAFDQTSKQTFDLVSCRTKACKLPSIRGKPNKKATNEKRQIFKEFPSILRAIKKNTQIAKEMQMLKMKMTQDITKQILNNEQTSSCKWMFFVEVFKSRYFSRPGPLTCDNM
jgi:hypothetical protein